MIALPPSLDGADQVTAIDELLPFALADASFGVVGTTPTEAAAVLAATVAAGPAPVEFEAVTVKVYDVAGARSVKVYCNVEAFTVTGAAPLRVTV